MNAASETSGRSTKSPTPGSARFMMARGRGAPLRHDSGCAAQRRQRSRSRFRCAPLSYAAATRAPFRAATSPAVHDACCFAQRCLCFVALPFLCALFSPRRTAPHRTAPHRTAPHRTAPHRTALSLSLSLSLARSLARSFALLCRLSFFFFSRITARAQLQATGMGIPTFSRGRVEARGAGARCGRGRTGTDARRAGALGAVRACAAARPF